MTSPFGPDYVSGYGQRAHSAREGVPYFARRQHVFGLSDDLCSKRGFGPLEPPLRIAHLGPCLCRGGAEQQLIDLSRFLDPSYARLEACLVTHGGRIVSSVCRDLPCNVHVVGSEEIQKAVAEFDLLLYWGVALDEYLSHPQERRAKCVYMAHGDTWWTRSLLEGSRDSVDHVVAVSRRVDEQTCQGFPTTVILNGIDTARLATTCSRDDVRSKLGFAPDDFVVGYVGRFSPEKRPELLIESIRCLPQQYKALLVGWGSMKAELLQLANDIIPNRYAFVCADQYLGDYYQAMDAFSLLSAQEGFALVFLEAMFSGLPVLATPVGAVPEIIQHRINGLIVDKGLEQITQTLCQLRQYPDWAAALGREASNYAMQQGHARRMAEDYLELFYKLVGRSWPPSTIGPLTAGQPYPEINAYPDSMTPAYAQELESSSEEE